MAAPKVDVIEAREVSSGRLGYAVTLGGIVIITLLGYLGFVSFLKEIMLAFSSYSLYLLAFVAAVATFFSPCSFPLLPGYLSLYYNTEEPEKRAKPLYRGGLAAMGVVSSTVILGLIIGLLGQGVASSFSVSGPNPGLLTQTLRFGLGTVLASLGAIQLSNATLHNHLLDVVTERFYSATGLGSKGLYIYGFGYNAAGIGCAGPIVGGLVAFALGSGGFLSAFAAFLVYSATMGSLMVGISLLVAESKTLLINSLKYSTPRIKRASSTILIGVGLFLVYSALDLQFFVQTFFPR